MSSKQTQKSFFCGKNSKGTHTISCSHDRGALMFHPYFGLFWPLSSLNEYTVSRLSALINCGKIFSFAENVYAWYLIKPRRHCILTWKHNFIPISRFQRLLLLLLLYSSQIIRCYVVVDAVNFTQYSKYLWQSAEFTQTRNHRVADI